LQIRAELAEKELALLQKEQELLDKEQTLLVLQEEVRSRGYVMSCDVNVTPCCYVAWLRLRAWLSCVLAMCEV
jgi:hypothetical protein